MRGGGTGGGSAPRTASSAPTRRPASRRASWLNQIEIYFSVVQRKALTPNDLASLSRLKDRLLRLERHYEQAAKPFEWKFTRRNLEDLMARLQERDMKLAAA